MKFFLDTANVDEIREAASWGVVDGVTTNPTLLARERERGNFRDILREICSIIDGPVTAEVTSLDAAGMLEEAHDLARIAENITIKVPITVEGLKTVHTLSREGIKTNMTLIFSSSQALLAVRAGANFVSPFVGRLDDISHVGMDVVEEIVTIFDNYGFEAEVVVGSIRNPLHVVDAALAGAHAATVPFRVFEQLVRHPLTDIGIERFLADWEKVRQAEGLR